MGKSLTQEQFLKKCLEKHGSRYDYKRSIYHRAIEKIIIICKTHGDFLISPMSHLQGSGCRECSLINAGSSKKEFHRNKKLSSFKVSNNTEYKEIPLTKGYTTIVDNEDFVKLMENSWSATARANKKKYAVGNFKGKVIPMHRFIMGITDPKIHVDHIDGNSLDNRKSNLRLCTPQQNNYNSVGYKNRTSVYKGVSLNKRNNKWIVQISINGKSSWGGTYENEIEAAKAYDVKAKELFGEFAYLNFS